MTWVRKKTPFLTVSGKESAALRIYSSLASDPNLDIVVLYPSLVKWKVLFLG